MNTFVNKEYNELIDSLISDGYLKTDLIIEAFRAIDRKEFVLDDYKDSAYANIPLPIGFGQTISQPLTVAFMIELLEPKPGEKILEIGSGSGWQTAMLSYIVSKEALNIANEVDDGQKGRIVSIERIAELKEMTEKNVSKYNFIEKKVAKIVKGDGSRGYKEEASYDKIISGAAASFEIPMDWKKQLKIGGRIVSPVGQSIAVIDKAGKNEYSQKEYFGFSFVPLISNN